MSSTFLKQLVISPTALVTSLENIQMGICLLAAVHQQMQITDKTTREFASEFIAAAVEAVDMMQLSPDSMAIVTEWSSNDRAAGILNERVALPPGEYCNHEILEAWIRLRNLEHVKLYYFVEVKDSDAYVLLRTREDFNAPLDEDQPILILETFAKGKQSFNFYDGTREFHKLLQAPDLHWNYPSESILGVEKANHTDVGFVEFNYFDLFLSVHKGGCGYIALANGCNLDPYKIALDIAETDKYSFLKPVLSQLSFYDKLDMVLPSACWLTTGMIAIWSRKRNIPVIIFKASTNRQGWVPSYVTDIGPIGPLTMIVCLRIDGCKFDSLKPVESAGEEKLRAIYHQLHNIMPADVSAVDESMDSELDGLLNLEAQNKFCQEEVAEVIENTKVESDGGTNDGESSDASDSSAPSLRELDNESSDESEKEDMVVDDEMQPGASDNDVDDAKVDVIVSASSVSSVSGSTDSSMGSTEYLAIIKKLKGYYNDRTRGGLTAREPRYKGPKGTTVYYVNTMAKGFREGDGVEIKGYRATVEDRGRFFWMGALGNARMTRNMIYDNVYNDYYACPYSYISRQTFLAALIPDYHCMDECMTKMFNSLGTTDLAKVGMNYSAIITSPKPTFAEPRITPGRGLATKKSLANSRGATGKQLSTPISTPKYVRSARQGKKNPVYAEKDSDEDFEDFLVDAESPVHAPSEKKIKANVKTPTFPPCQPNLGGRRVIIGHTSEEVDTHSDMSRNTLGVKQSLPAAFPEVEHKIRRPQPPTVVLEAPSSFVSEQQMQEKMAKMFDDMCKQRLNLQHQPDIPPTEVLAKHQIDNNYIQRELDANVDMTSRRRHSLSTIPHTPNNLDPPFVMQHGGHGQSLVPSSAQFSFGQQMPSMPTSHPPALDHSFVVSSMIDNFVRDRNIDRLQRCLEESRLREEQYRDRELLEKMMARMSGFRG